MFQFSDKFIDYSKMIKEELLKNKIRVEVDSRIEKIGYKIREARNERVPYMLIIGGKEKENNYVSVRSRENGDEGGINIEEFIARLKGKI